MMGLSVADPPTKSNSTAQRIALESTSCSADLRCISFCASQIKALHPPRRVAAHHRNHRPCSSHSSRRKRRFRSMTRVSFHRSRRAAHRDFVGTFASWRMFDNHRRIVEGSLSGTRRFLVTVFALGGLFYVGSANAQGISIRPLQPLYDPAEKGRSVIDGCQRAPSPHACRQECYNAFGYGGGYRQCIWGD